MNGGSATVTKDERLEWMRLNAEKDRIQKFKSIAVDQSKVYYSLLETFNKMLELRKEPPVPSMIHMQASASASQLSSELNSGQRDSQQMDFKSRTEQLMVNSQLMVTLDYITEFMRQVIENGCAFTSNHFFICMLHLDPQQVNQTLAAYLKAVVQAVQVSKEALLKFVQGITD